MIEGLFEYIKGFIKKVDLFGVSFSFKYKCEEKYSTYTGGIICLIFCICSIIYCLINFVLFIN